MTPKKIDAFPPAFGPAAFLLRASSGPFCVWGGARLFFLIKGVGLLWLVALISFANIGFAAAEPPLSQRMKLWVNRIDLRGNVVISTKELSEICAPYENREITMEELNELREKLTRLHTDRGHINSGAIIPEQDAAGGVIEIVIIEGKIVATRVSGGGRLKKRYIVSRLKSALPKDRAFNIKSLENSLKMLKQDRRIENINAAISPGLKAGEARLDIEIDQARPWRMRLGFNNHGSPGIGSFQGETMFSWLNLTGWGDTLGLNYKKTAGFDHYSVNYAIPLTRWETAFEIDYSRSGSTVVSWPFNRLDIKSDAKTLAVSLRQPVHRTLSKEFALGLGLEKRSAETYLLGIPFSFTSHADGYKTEATQLSFFQEWVWRGATHALALRSDFRFGLNWLGATVYKEKDDEAMEYADSEYMTWFGQFQWFKRIKPFKSEFLLKTNIQLTNDSQLPSGAFSIGGSAMTRGYRENQMTVDNGIASSLEWRVPAFHLKWPGLAEIKSDGQIQLFVFFDWGRGWNVGGRHPVPDEIYSVGAGLIWSVNEKIKARICYGRRLAEVDAPSDYDLQDDGVHFGVTVDFF